MDNETKHTPAPWTWGAASGEKTASVFNMERGLKKICGLYSVKNKAGCHGVSVEQMKANACLISAAPDMLMLLELQSALESPRMTAIQHNDLNQRLRAAGWDGNTDRSMFLRELREKTIAKAKGDRHAE